MITRSPVRLRPAGAHRGRAGRRARTRAAFPRYGEARCPDPIASIGNKRRGATVANNYWSASTISTNPNNAWNVNFNNGNVNNNDKNNNLWVRAVRPGS